MRPMVKYGPRSSCEPTRKRRGSKSRSCWSFASRPATEKSASAPKPAFRVEDRIMKRHERRAGAHADVEQTSWITPMLDMAFQLLFFFICIYRPPTSREVEMDFS